MSTPGSKGSTAYTSHPRRMKATNSAPVPPPTTRIFLPFANGSPSKWTYDGGVPAASEPPLDSDEAPADASGVVFEPGFPNPFQTSTTLAFVLDAPGPVRMRVVDVLGREVARLVDGVLPADRHTVRYDAGALPEGLYFCEFVAGTQRLVRTLVRLR